MNQKVYSAVEIYQKLLDAGIKEAKGKITIDFMGVSTLVRKANAIGDLFQEWLKSWFDENNMNYLNVGYKLKGF